MNRKVRTQATVHQTVPDSVTESGAAAVAPSAWRPQYRRNLPALALSVWWACFAAISFYWAMGGMWLVDSAVGDQGQALARERPTWLVALVAGTGFIKLLPVLFGYLVVAPVGRRLPRALYIVCGFLGGAAAVAYGLGASLPGIGMILEGELSPFGWMRMLVWMPQFWVGGLLSIITTVVFARTTSANGPNA